MNNREKHQKELDLNGCTVFESAKETRCIGVVEAKDRIDYRMLVYGFDSEFWCGDFDKYYKSVIDGMIEKMFDEAMGDYYDE